MQYTVRKDNRIGVHSSPF